MKLHERIDAIRESKGITQTHVARVCGRNPQWYYDIKTGHSTIKAEDLPNIAKALGVDMSVFFDKKLSVTQNNEKQAI